MIFTYIAYCLSGVGITGGPPGIPSSLGPDYIRPCSSRCTEHPRIRSGLFPKSDHTGSHIRRSLRAHAPRQVPLPLRLVFHAAFQTAQYMGQTFPMAAAVPVKGFLMVVDQASLIVLYRCSCHTPCPLTSRA